MSKRVLWVGIPEQALPKASASLVNRPETRRVRIKGLGHQRVTVQLLRLRPVVGPIPAREFFALGAELAEVPLGFRHPEHFVKAIEPKYNEACRRKSEVALTILSELLGHPVRPDSNGVTFGIAEVVQ